MRKIDADALDQELEKVYADNLDGIVRFGIEKCIDVVKHALTINDGWIPVTERLPEINVEVIVTDIETIGTYASWYLGEGFWECDNGKFNNRIIAWMPLPKPYTKEEQS